MKLEAIKVKLEDLYLDPNNYRFIDNEDYYYVSNNDAVNRNNQLRTLKFITGKNNEEILDLIESMKDNGYLQVDNIQVKRVGEEKNKYIVIEGNRRVASLKYLEKLFKTNGDIGRLDPKVFKRLEVFLSLNETEEEKLIIMGLKHISGNKKWESVNQAQLIYDYLKKYIGEENYLEVEKKLSKSLAVSQRKIKEHMNTFHLIELYKNSEYGDFFVNRMFSIFAEAIKKGNVCEWLGWDKESYISYNLENLEKFFSWISPLEYETEYDKEFYIEEEEAIIKRGADIRDLNLFIRDVSAVEAMEKERDISEGVRIYQGKQRVDIAFMTKSLSDEIKYIFKYEHLLTPESKNEIKEIKKIFSLNYEKSVISTETMSTLNLFPLGINEHFSKIEILDYKILKNFTIDKLSKINILTGLNNSGKTTLIEAIYILANQNNIFKYFDLIKNRQKEYVLNYKYLDDITVNNFKIKGIFNKIDLNLEMFKYDAKDIDKKGDYVKSYGIKSITNNKEFEMNVHTYLDSDIESKYENIVKLCNSNYQTPYISLKKEMIENYSKIFSEESNEMKADDKIIKFIKKIDSKIEKITFINSEGIQRFTVQTTNGEIKDIRAYGEGVQRIYSLILSFITNKDGIIVIDELEVGLHFSILVDFTKFIQELSEEFNVQVFITTHSRECVEAFVKNKYQNEMISIHLLENLDGKIERSFLSGERYEKLLNKIKLDVRGGKHE
ncbi:MAG: AAA family ATPase [Cetobacterium sp.]|nr:AAA family ATPase [Cetobacterium sp.]